MQIPQLLPVPQKLTDGPPETRGQIRVTAFTFSLLNRWLILVSLTAATYLIFTVQQIPTE